MKNVESCPYCGEEKEIRISTKDMPNCEFVYLGKCQCGALGPHAKSIVGAEIAWNRGSLECRKGRAPDDVKSW